MLRPRQSRLRQLPWRPDFFLGPKGRRPLQAVPRPPHSRRTSTLAFREIAARLWEEERLFTALFELTYRCNLDCWFCYNDLSLVGQPLETPDWLQTIDALAEMGALNLILSGGEPLAHPDFFTIGAYARERGFAVRVKSNGHALRGAMLERLHSEVDPFLIEVSLHGDCASTHDQQTQVAGSFERLLENLEEIKGRGMRLKINSTLTRWNEDQIEGMYAIADRLGVALQIDPEVTVRDDGDDEPLAISASDAAVARLFRIQAERIAAARDRERAEQAQRPSTESPARSTQKPPPRTRFCGAGSSTLAIDPFGNVYPCVQWRRSIGNLRESSLREIWQAEPVRDLRDLNREVLVRVERSGPNANLMSFCPGAAESRTGDPLEVHAAAKKRGELKAAAQSGEPIAPSTDREGHALGSGPKKVATPRRRLKVLAS